MRAHTRVLQTALEFICLHLQAGCQHLSQGTSRCALFVCGFDCGIIRNFAELVVEYVSLLVLHIETLVKYYNNTFPKLFMAPCITASPNSLIAMQAIFAVQIMLCLWFIKSSPVFAFYWKCAKWSMSITLFMHVIAHEHAFEIRDVTRF